MTFTSSIAVYGDRNTLKDEDSQLLPNGPYGRSKYMAERILELWQINDLKRRKLSICRPAVIFGVGEKGNFTRLANALRKNRFFYPGNSTTIKSSGYVKDLSRALLFMTSTGEAQEIFNFAFPVPYRISDICEAFHKIVGFNLPRTLKISKLISLFILFPGVVGRLGARMQKLVISTHVLPSKLQDYGFQWDFDLESAIADWRSESNGNFFI